MTFTGGFWHFEDSVPLEELVAAPSCRPDLWKADEAGPPPSLLPRRPLPMMRLQIDTGCLFGPDTPPLDQSFQRCQFEPLAAPADAVAKIFSFYRSARNGKQAVSAFLAFEEEDMAVSFDLSGKTAIVTGANTGLGQAIAVALAGAGADVALVGRSSMSETEAAIAAAGGGKSCTIKADLSTIEPVQDVIDQTIAWTGRADILVNNAGIIRRADAIDFSEADWDAVMDVNLKTVFFLSQAFARRLISEGKSGKIINIASLLSFQGGIRIPSYTASKSGLAGLTRLLACEWAGKGINVNAIAPGYFSTNNTEALRNDPDRNSAILGRIPAGHWGQPEELGGAAVFLASPAADYVHGVVLPVDGGWLAR